MARTPTSTASSASETQAAASTALAALLARRRGIKVKPSAGVRKVRKPKAKKVEIPEKEKSKIIAHNVTVLKGAGKVGEKEREVRMRILGMREEKSGKKKAKRVVVEDSDSD